MLKHSALWYILPPFELFSPLPYLVLGLSFNLMSTTPSSMELYKRMFTWLNQQGMLNPSIPLMSASITSFYMASNRHLEPGIIDFWDFLSLSD